MAAEEQAVPNRAERRSSGGGNSDAPFSRQKRFELADLLRDCAALVEQNEMEQKTFQKMFRELTEYVSAHGGGKVSDSSVASAAASVSPTPSEETAPAPTAKPTVATVAPDPPASTQKAPSARKVTTTTTTKHIPAPSAAPTAAARPVRQDEHALSKEKSVNFIDSLKKNVKVFGEEVTQIAHTARTEAAKKATSAKNALRVKNELGSELGDEWEEHGSGGRTSTSAAAQASAPNQHRPPFQRPVNPNSTLIANGWLEQQRRSKMRFVWKEVLVSLVAGRKPGEETTLWVQRETVNPTTGQSGLEALHQIPVKGMQDVNYVDFSTDHRFVIQVYNLSDEFVFRTPNQADAAKNWVSTLRLTREAIMNGVPPPKAGDLQGASKRTKHYPGYTGEDEKKAESPPQQQPQKQQPPPPQQQKPPTQPKAGRTKISVKELRAIAHGHGVNTAGMERGELEAVVAKIQQQQQQQNGRTTPTPHPTAPPPPSAQKPTPPAEESANPFDEDMSERAATRARQMKMDEEAAARLAAEERIEAERQRMAAQAKAAEEQRRRAEYLRQQEALRQQQAQQAARQKWEEEQRRQQQYYAQQQAYAQQQQQWHQQQQQQQRQQWQQQQWHQQQQQAHAHAHHFPGHQTPPPGHHPHAQPGAQPRPGGPPPAGNSQVNQKWAKQMDDSGAESITALKHHILTQWALQPPNMQMLRTIDVLLTTIHSVFPPTKGVPGHDYFKKWKTVSMESLSEEGRPDENKLAKAVKKLRFFLHPDKLPRDLSEDQSFVCKMLWDITSDAWEEYEKKKEDLDWLNQS
ncbi:expressed unknown protein [Seminavis robusta]|uniref:PH domain-containing protein n=1 Tax=Seminavis robusta TaxID=568900 RepID=A0A9N8HNK2_9STRA|nr:expressed unknown protein [Seminavis robusta]|eukprot:Sro1003_g230040.1 n/a (802) ;mRNA; f:20842-23327